MNEFIFTACTIYQIQWNLFENNWYIQMSICLNIFQKVGIRGIYGQNVMRYPVVGLP